MAFCMKCSQAVPDLTIVCPYCNHDFMGTQDANLEGWEYSGFADIVLLVGAIVSVLVSVVLGLATIVMVFLLLGNLSLWQETLWNVVQAGIGCCLALANLVVFLRVADLSRDRSSRR